MWLPYTVGLLKIIRAVVENRNHVKSETTLTQEISAALDVSSHQGREDRRIPVLVLLQGSLADACSALSASLASMASITFDDLILISSESPDTYGLAPPRFEQVQSDELVQAQGCLCCSLRSELAQVLSQIFLRVLRREIPAVRLVVIVSTATDADPLRQTLRHAPFLGQRYRLAASHCLPPESV